MSIWEGFIATVLTTIVCKTVIYLYAIRKGVSISEGDTDNE